MNTYILRKLTALNKLSFLAITILLFGCTSPNDQISLSELADKGTGVVFISASFPDLKCLHGNTVRMGKLEGDYYLMTGVIKVGKPLKLEAGTHYVTLAYCHTRITRTRYIGREYVFGKSKAYSSYARITVQPGQVTDVGKLVVYVDPSEIRKYSDHITNVARVEAIPLSSVEQARMLKEFPTLYGSAKKMLMSPQIQVLKRP